MGVVFFFFPSPIVKVFSDDQGVIDLATGCLRLVAISQPALATIMVLARAERGRRYQSDCQDYSARFHCRAVRGLHT